MRKSIVSILAALAVLASLGWACAEEPKAKPAKKTAVEDRQKQRVEALGAAISGDEYNKAVTILEEMQNDKELSDDARFKAGLTEFVLLATEMKDGAKACVVAKKLSEMKKDSAELLNELAWTILDTPKLKNRDLAVALAIAKQAAEVSKHVDGAILDTLARAYFETNDLDKAIEWQTKAIEKCDANDMIPDDVKAQVKATLEKYQQAKKAKKAS